jgi:glycosyltransferase involved in cell wall biosynthesis
MPQIPKKLSCGWFLTDLTGGGAERVPLVIAAALREVDLSVVLLKNRVQHALPPEGLEVLRLSSSGMSLGWAGAGVLARAAAAARSFDVLVAGLEWTPTFFAVPCGLVTRRPVIATVHVDLRRYAEHEPVPAAWWKAMRWALKHCAAVVAVSEDVRNAVLELGVAPGRVRVIPNPVAFVAGERKRMGDVPEIVTVASLKSMKGIGVALEAAAKLRDINYQWTFVGDGPEADRFRDMADELGLSDRVRFVGFQQDPQPFYRRSDIYVLPSFTEGFGLSLVEAMSAGLPVVATRCGRVVEGLVSAAGELVPVGDATALADGIRRLLEDPERRDSLGEAARGCVLAFEPTTVARQYEQLLMEIAPAGRLRS